MSTHEASKEEEIGKYADFSGLSASQDASANPYDTLIAAAHNDPVSSVSCKRYKHQIALTRM